MGVTVKKKSSALLAVIAVYSPTQAYDELFLSNYVTINLLDQIRSTSGVGDAQLFGPQDYSMRIWLKTDQLTGLGLTTGDVISAIQTQNVQAAVGRIGARPVSDDQQLQLNIQTKGRLSSTEEFERIIIRSNPDGSVLRLGDIARMELGAANLDRATRLNGAAATLIGIYQAPGANALRSVDALNKLLADNAKSFPEGVAWKVTYDPTVFVRATIEKVKHTLVEAALLVLLVVFIFLGNIRATLIPMIAVPVSLIGELSSQSYWIFRQHGIASRHDPGDRHRGGRRHRRGRSRRTDDGGASRVVGRRSNQTRDARYLRADHRNHTSAACGVRAGRLHFRHFRRIVPAVRRHGRGLDVPVGYQRSDSIAGSLRSPAEATSWDETRLDGNAEPGNRQVRDGYGLAVARLVRLAIVGIVVVVAAFAGIGLLARATPTGFIPSDDQGAFFVVVQLPDGASIGRTSDVVRQVEDSLKKEKPIADVNAIIGLNFVDNYSQPNSDSWSSRSRTSRNVRSYTKRRCDHRAARSRAARGKGRRAVPLGAAADHRPRHRRRLQLRAAGFAGRRTCRTWPRCCAGW